MKDAETKAEAADPGKFFRESAVLTPYRRARLVGPHVATAATAAKPQPAAKPAAPAAPTRATGILDAITAKPKPTRG